ncbi:MAG TPA: hypothetical protein VEX11_03450 [Acetobacteraceae bacterium]|nr:hypothetical protein [Acetobacteraceae bacterium]
MPRAAAAAAVTAAIFAAGLFLAAAASSSGAWAKDPVVEAAEGLAAAIRAQTRGGQPSLPGAAAPRAAADAPSVGPKRRDGYWEMRSLREDGSVRDTQFLCVGGGSENEFSIWDQITIMGNCSRKELVRSGAGWTFDARCELFGSVMESKGTMSGDFRDRFRVDLTVVNDGRRQAGSIRGEHKGACPAPFKPGDLVSDGGRVLMNVLN